MAQKDLIIGAFNNYTDYDVLKPWVQSIKDTGFDGDVVLIAIDAPKSIVLEIENAGVTVVEHPKQGNMMVHMMRFLYIYDFLKKYHNKYRFVITTDVRDVIFQSNPSLYLQKIYGSRDKGIMAQSEAILIQHEQWNRDNIIKNFGQYFYEDIKEKEVFNVGILAGTTEYIKDLCFALFQMSSNRPDWVADQAAYNMLLNFKPWNNVTTYLSLKDCWALNAHVTNKPDQMEQFGPYLLEKRPYMEDGTVKNSNGKPFVIVHQYDRVPEWMEYFSKKYGTNITKDTNTGTSPKYFTYNT
jgi:hypothetical protein